MSKLGKLLHEDPELQDEFDQAIKRRVTKLRKKLEWEIVQHHSV